MEDTSYEEMQKYRLAETKERIPLLSEVLQLVDGKVPLLIEVKLPNTDTKICRKLDEELRKYHGEYMIQSFNSLDEKRQNNALSLEILCKISFE